MRADRLLSILLMLQSRGQITAGDLAARLEVSERTIHRDMEALSIAGVPVYATRGTGGGWSLSEEYRAETGGLNEAEVQAVFLTRPQKLLSDLGLNQAAEVGLLKLLSALPQGRRGNAEQTMARIHFDVAGWRDQEEAVPLLPMLHRAVQGERCIEIAYVRGDGEASERIIDPLGLVAKGHVWYLVGASGEQFRTFRVSRIRRAELTDRLFTRPPGFDLASYWESSKTDFVVNLPRVDIAFLADEPGIDALRNASRWSQIESIQPSLDASRSRVNMRFDRVEEAINTALAFGPAVELIEPPELRAEIAARLEGASALYTRLN